MVQNCKLSLFIEFEFFQFSIRVQVKRGNGRPVLCIDTPNSDKTIFVSNVVELHGGQIHKVSFYNNERGKTCVGLELTDDGSKAMKATTSRNLQKQLAIILNGKIVNAPKIMSTITKNVVINGDLSNKDLLAFFQAIVLRTAP